MRGSIATAGLAAALLLAGCDKAEDTAANNSAASAITDPVNDALPDVDENVIGVPELAPGNDVKGNDDPAVNAAGSDKPGSEDR